MRQPRPKIRRLFSMAALAAALLVAACAPKSPEEKVASLRARYTATLNGFFTKAPEPPAELAEPAEAEAAAASATAVGAAEAAEGVEGEEGAAEGEMEEDAGPRTSEVVLDILIRHDSDERLDGITLDISQVDTAKREKASWRAWFDTSGTPKATPQQVTYTLEGVEYEDGDGFSVEVRSVVPPAERGEYREFAAAGG